MGGDFSTHSQSATLRKRLLHPFLRTFLRQGQYGFAFGWDFYEVQGHPPAGENENVQWHSGKTLFAKPAWTKHTTHFAESVAFLFHASLYDLSPPPSVCFCNLLPSWPGASDVKNQPIPLGKS